MGILSKENNINQNTKREMLWLLGEQKVKWQPRAQQALFRTL